MKRHSYYVNQWPLSILAFISSARRPGHEAAFLGFRRALEGGGVPATGGRRTAPGRLYVTTAPGVQVFAPEEIPRLEFQPRAVSSASRFLARTRKRCTSWAAAPLTRTERNTPSRPGCATTPNRFSRSACWPRDSPAGRNSGATRCRRPCTITPSRRCAQIWRAYNRAMLASPIKPFLAAVAAIVMLEVGAAAARTLDIYFIDVEGGQSTLVITPAGQSLLIDTGYPERNGRDPDRIDGRGEGRQNHAHRLPADHPFPRGSRRRRVRTGATAADR